MSYIFYRPISEPYQTTQEMLSWAKEHCASFLTNDVEKRTDDWYYRFYFADEKDMLMFTLRWS